MQRTTKDREGTMQCKKGHPSSKTHQCYIYAGTERTVKYVKIELRELKRETDKSSITVGEFSTPLSIIDKTTRQKFSKI